MRRLLVVLLLVVATCGLQLLPSLHTARQTGEATLARALTPGKIASLECDKSSTITRGSRFAKEAGIGAVIAMLGRSVFKVSSFGSGKIVSQSQSTSLPVTLVAVLSNLRGGHSVPFNGVDWRYFVAGAICAAYSHGITTPIDVVKTRMQASPESYDKGFIQAAKDIIFTDGPLFLLSGLWPTTIGYGFEGALKFGLYETLKTILSKFIPYKLIAFLVASIFAGIVASVVLCPMEETRIKMVTDESWKNEDIMTGIPRLLREGGVLTTFAGLPAMLSKQIPYTISKQVSFDMIAALFYYLIRVLNIYKSESVIWLISLASAFCTSLVSCIGSQPGDMILTMTYNSKDGNKGFRTIVKSIYRRHGLKGFFIGLDARIVHVISIVTSQLMLYDIIKVSMGLGMTGSR